MMRSLTPALILAALSFLYRPAPAAVQNLAAVYRAGKTYITWTEDSDPAKSYRLYRSKNPIATVSGLTALVDVARGSSYDSRFSRYHIISDLGSPLSASTGLFVYTPRDTASVYYAVTTVSSTVEDPALSSGQNSLAQPVAEARWPWPRGVLRAHTPGSNDTYEYFYWMDYFDWPNKYDYYGDNFVVTINGGTAQKMPMSIYLHGYSGTPGWNLPSGGVMTNGIRLNVVDNDVPGATIAHTWWYAIPNNYGVHTLRKGDTLVDFTSLRVVTYIQSVKTDPRFPVDTNRIYLSGQSMGGAGTFLIGMHYPNVFAALQPIIGRVTFPESYMTDQWLWGPLALGLTARNGVSIYKWSQPAWVSEHSTGVDFPPIDNLHGSRDGLHPMYTHTHVYEMMASHHQGIWGKWLDIDHETATYGVSIPGGYMRFRKDEAYPAFSNATTDDNFGNVVQWDTNSIPVKPANFACDPAGIMNNHLDWTSSLHDLGLPNDNLVDRTDSFSMTFKAARPNTSVDITPRRVQRFPQNPNGVYHWANLDAVSGALGASGDVTADAGGRVTVPQFAVATTGSRLVITVKSLGVSAVPGGEGLAGVSGILAEPNPFTASVRLRAAVPRLEVYDLRGKRVAVLRSGGKNDFEWNATGVAPGLYIVRGLAGSRALTLPLARVR